MMMFGIFYVVLLRHNQRHRVMEKFIHYVWKHKMFPLAPLHTTKGELVEVIDCGLHNSDAGPDFFNAKMKIGGTLWVGNVEMHDKSSDWYVHGHDKNEAYNKEKNHGSIN